MKKKLIAIMLVLLLAVTAFSGCTFIEKDNERDVAQVVATVKTGDRTDYIYKRDLISYYNTYGYYYSYYYGMSMEETLDFLLDQLVNRQIMLQEAERSLPVLTENAVIVHEGKNYTHPLMKYLSQNQINLAQKGINESINSSIESYLETSSTDDDHDEHAGHNHGDEETRTAPTYEVEEEEEIVTAEDIPAVDKDSTTAIKNAYTQFIKGLKKNYMNYEEYYEMLVEGALEDRVIEVWGDTLVKDSKISFAELTNRYNEMKDTQKEAYVDPADYKTALDEVSSSKFVLYNPAVGYGYVYNLLVPFSDYEAKILSFQTTRYQAGEITKADYEAIRAALLQGIVAKDLRETWITAGYDFDFETKTFGKDYCKTEGIPFGGTVYNEESGERVEITTKPGKQDKVKYCFDIDEVPMSDFMVKVNTLMNATAKDVAGTNYYAAGQVELANLETAKAVFMDLMFAYSSDTGNLNSFKGYVSAPKPSDNATESFVAEFADAARDVVSQGAGNYVVVGTDYGWHIVYCTEAISAGTAEELVEADMDVFGTFTYRFKTAIMDSVHDNILNEKQNEVFNQYRDNASMVKTYKNAYADLIAQ